MRFLSFDIECAKVYKNYSPICNFGYVIYDENLNLIEKKDMMINPKSKFKLEGRKGREDIKLFYSEAEYKKAESFDVVYPRIKEVLESPNQIILNHAVINDIIYLNNDCNRYGLPMIRFEAYDTMEIYKSLNNHQGSIGLEKILKQFNTEKDFIHHKADEDANAAMICFIESCKLLDLKALEMIEVANLNPLSSVSLKAKGKKAEKKKRVKDDQISEISNFFENELISYSLVIEKDPSKYENIIYSVKQLGGILTKKVSESSIFIFDESSHCKRCDSFITNTESGKEIKAYAYKDFMSLVEKKLIEGLLKVKNS